MNEARGEHSRSRPRILGRLAAFVLAAGGGGIVIFAAVHGIGKVIDRTSASERKSAEHLAAWDRCIERQIRHAVPRGSRVHIPAQDEYWRQSLPGLSLPWARPVPLQTATPFGLTVIQTGNPADPGRWCGPIDASQQFPFNTRVRLELEVTRP